MEMLQKLWPTPFKVKKGDVASLLIQLIIFLVVCVVIGFALGLLWWVPIVNIIAGILGALLELYSLVGIVLCLLKFFDVLK
ncbi:MAG: hypothetical protein IJX13_04110 [Clostridia bacterium]|nr:hypothetical protein [Clostridia bacterium]